MSILLLCLHLLLFSSTLSQAHEAQTPASCSHHHHHHHHHTHLDHVDDHHHHHHRHDHHHHHECPRQSNFERTLQSMLPEELAEDEELALTASDFRFRRQPDLSGVGLWIRAMGCSLLVSLASLVCIIILPIILLKGKPSKTVVDCLAVFGAGAMLGDAFLHQLPHAFGSEHLHPHDHHSGDMHDQSHHHGHAHSLKDLSIGMSVLSGIVLFLLVEKVVRYVEYVFGTGGHVWGHGHHHYHHKVDNKLKDDDGSGAPLNETSENASEMVSDQSLSDGVSDCIHDENHSQNDIAPRKRSTTGTTGVKKDSPNGVSRMTSSIGKEHALSSRSLVFGYLNLFSDGVHNFTDGMALGSAFLLYGSVGGWSRTLFLLVHELPQEIGDFGILVRSGFSVSKALIFNFLSAVVALAGTALALIIGKDPGHSSLIEGFTAGGFIYIAVAGVLPEMNSGKTTLKIISFHLLSLILGMAVALCISLVE